MQNRPHALRAGFSLIELLVVVSVIALLAAIVLPSLSTTRQQASRVMCAANMRQWGFAMQVYAQQNRDVLPRRGQGVQPTTIINRTEDWFNALPPLLKERSLYERVMSGSLPRPPARSIWCCPSAVDNGQPYHWSYGMNMWLSVWIGARPDRLSNVGPPATMVTLADGPGNHCSVLPSNQGYSPVARHGGAVNMCFLDSHVSSYSGKVVGCGIGLTQRSDIRWRVPGSAWPGPQ